VIGPAGPARSVEDEGRAQAVVAQLWPAVAAAGCLGLFLPLALYLVNLGHNRFARHHAAEATNATITFVLVGVPLSVGAFAWSLAGLDGDAPWRALWGYAAVLGFLAVELGVGILGAVRASQGVWWRHPLAIPFLRAHRRESAPDGVTSAP